MVCFLVRGSEALLRALVELIFDLLMMVDCLANSLLGLWSLLVGSASTVYWLELISGKLVF